MSQKELRIVRLRTNSILCSLVAGLLSQEIVTPALAQERDFGMKTTASKTIDNTATASMHASELIEPLRPYVNEVMRSLGEIPTERRAVLDDVVRFISDRAKAKRPVKLLFICTHNSRRSHLAQIWAQTAATSHGISAVQTYSGGVETTACNPRTVQALRRAGFSVAASSGGTNPVYLVQFADEEPPLKCTSKSLRDLENPSADFAALLCCSDADAKCPIVHGAAVRFRLNYEDPKAADGSPDEAAVYDRRCRQIAVEMFYVMSKAAEYLAK